ncbi:MAG: CDP-alcohol phosphatidyltransferase family protein [bacterium]
MKLKFSEINTISNYISFFRLLLGIPIFFLLDYIHIDYSYRLLLIGFYFIGYVSDLLDGYLARKLNQISEFGKIIDPLADKICVGIVVFKMYLISEIPDYYFWIIIMRDVLIFTGGILISKKIGRVLPSNLLGKLTVTSIGIFLIVVTLGVQEDQWYYTLTLYLSLIMSFASVIGYSIRAFDVIKWNKDETF